MSDRSQLNCPYSAYERGRLTEWVMLPDELNGLQSM